MPGGKDISINDLSWQDESQFLSYAKEIARDGMLLTCEMDALALKVYELKSKCLFCEYFTLFFEKNIT